MSTLSNNSAIKGGGGAIAAVGNSYVRLTHTTMSFNYAKANGAALALSGMAGADVFSSTFTGNAAGLSGGAIAVGTGRDVSIINSSLVNNTARADGGAIAVSKSGFVRLENSLLLSNRALLGGAVSLAHAKVYFGATRVASNYALMGAGVHADKSYVVSFDASYIINNTARSGGGGLALFSPNIFRADMESAGSTQCSPYNVFLQNGTRVANNTVRESPLQTGGGFDIFANPAVALAIPLAGSNLQWNSSTVLWEVKCPHVGQPLVLQKGECSTCNPLTYHLVVDNVTESLDCRPCPFSANCPGGVVIAAKPKFWHTYGPRGSVPSCSLDNITRWVGGSRSVSDLLSQCVQLQFNCVRRRCGPLQVLTMHFNSSDCCQPHGAQTSIRFQSHNWPGGCTEVSVDIGTHFSLPFSILMQINSC